ncbi:MAG: hypothetical protein KIS74_00700 [Burkholderiales bacterium]|nr:hypothetical protein [Burkholderiales bacterium]
MKIPATIALLALPSLGLASDPSDRVASAKDPTDPAAAVAPLRHPSPFVRYRPFSEKGVGSWREANDEVARIGGWKAYAREVFEANEAARAAESAKDRTGSPSAGSREGK